MPTPFQIQKLKQVKNPLFNKKYTKFYQLPKNVQEKMFAVETADLVRKIGKDNNLNENQLQQFSYAIGMVLLGDLHISKFVKTLQEKCKLDETASRRLARQINQELFLPIKESLKQIHRLPKWPAESEATNQQPSAQAPTPVPPPIQRPTSPQQPRISPMETRRQTEEEKRTVNLRK